MKVSLLMVTNDGKSREFPVSTFPATIGRGDECKLRIPLAAVSRKHCELDEDDDELVIRDLGSANGTYVNKHRVKQRELIPGDLIAVGPVVFVVRIDGHPKETDPRDAFSAGAVASEGGREDGGGARGASGNAPTELIRKPATTGGKPAAAGSAGAGGADAGGGGGKPMSIDDELDAILRELGEDDDPPVKRR